MEKETKKIIRIRKPKAEVKTPTVVPLEAVVYNQSGKESGSLSLPEKVFGAKWNPDLVHQVIVAMEANARIPIAHTKQRGEVRGGGRKPWQQKGTGRARHGSIRSPLWRGGGITFGPNKEKVFGKKVNKKMRVQALFSALSRKYKDGEVLFIEGLSFAQPKTKEARKVLDAFGSIAGFEKIATKKKNSMLLALSSRSEPVERSFANFGNIKVEEARNLNPVDVLKFTYVAFVEPKESLLQIANRSATAKAGQAKK